MEAHVGWVQLIANKLFGKLALALLAALHIQPSNPQFPIPNHVATEFLVFGVSAVFFLWLKSRISVESPGATQQCMEMVLTNPVGVGVRDLLDDNVGHGSGKYLAMIGSVGIFVLLCNLISLIPSLESPTAEVSVPLGCATVVFLYYNWCGIAKKGVLGYGKVFLGPILWMSIIMLPIEIISNLARLLSLTVRLWVNMFVSELLYGIFLGLLLQLFLFLGGLNVVGYISAVLPFIVPPAFMGLHMFVAVLQAFVFTILPIIYLSGAVAEEH
ncbi:MAG: F0F1 ATP synthase subunit A [Candidatus Acidiferrales bacterium]